MQNPIEKLMEEVAAVAGNPDLDNEACERAVRRRFGYFAAQWEAVEVEEHGGHPGLAYDHGHWMYLPDDHRCGLNKPTFRGTRTILAPRKPKSERDEVLDAAEAVEAWCRCTNHWRGMPAELHQKCDALATAIKKERAR